MKERVKRLTGKIKLKVLKRRRGFGAIIRQGKRIE